MVVVVIRGACVWVSTSTSTSILSRTTTIKARGVKQTRQRTPQPLAMVSGGWWIPRKSLNPHLNGQRAAAKCPRLMPPLPTNKAKRVTTPGGWEER